MIYWRMSLLSSAVIFSIAVSPGEVRGQASEKAPVGKNLPPSRLAKKPAPRLRVRSQKALSSSAKKQRHKKQVKGRSSKKAQKLAKRQVRLGKMAVSPVPKKEVKIIKNDPLIDKKWSLKKVKASAAWLKFSKGSRKIVVAVVDTGIDIRHPDLKRNIWTNPREIPNNNKDDDNNGFVDDVHGWNFVHNNNKVYDTHGHGTHVAGIIGAEGGNGIGISGVAPRVSLMALKYYDPQDAGNNNLKNTVLAINYAVKNGAHIINYSGGGLTGNPDEKAAIQRAEKKGILFVAAAGNESSNMDKQKYYPASYALSNILPVTATDIEDQVLRSSNWGKKSVQGAAPGKRIFSTLPGGRYGFMTGTSQATPLAAGAAVLVMAYYNYFSPKFVISQLRMTGDIKKSLEAKTTQRRRLNIFRAIQMRGKQVNSMDEFVDDSGKTFLSGDGEKGIPSHAKPLEQELKELATIFSTSGGKKRREKGLQKSATRNIAKKQKRSPASTSPQNKKPSLQRWSWSPSE